MFYRAEIDGLRSLAILPVILFHAGFSAFSGGYIGVDVFFVISGYLITNVILSDLDTGCFSFSDFYERRARRILPALFFVVVVSFSAAWFLLLPPYMKDFSQSLVSTSLFSSNILFMLQNDYFDSSAHLKPLLHTWSLSVEEQFYLVFPVTLVLLTKVARLFVTEMLMIIALCSLALMLWLISSHPSAAFYLFPARAWELLMGSFAAILLKKGWLKKPSKAQCSQFSAAGLFLILLSVFLFDDAIPFPSLWALLPTTGAFLVILFAVPGVWVNRLLSHRVLVFIGLLSYSAYLWHYPLLVFSKHALIEELDSRLKLTLCGITFCLSYLSWRFIEKPFRNRQFLAKRSVAMFSGFALVLPLLLGFLGHLNKGFPDRVLYGEELSLLDKALSVNHGLARACDREFSLVDECLHGSAPVAALWGDSYAMHLAAAIAHSSTDLPFRQHTLSSCRPVLGLSIVGGEHTNAWAKKCIAFNDRVFDWLEKSPQIELVIISSQFLFSSKEMLTRLGRKNYDNSVVERHFGDTLLKLTTLGKTVILVSPTPGNDRDLGLCLGKAKLFGYPLSGCDFPVADFSEDVLEGLGLLKRTYDERVSYLWLDKLICRAGACFTSDKDIFLYRDKGHLSNAGSAHMGEKFDIAGLLLNEL